MVETGKTTRIKHKRGKRKLKVRQMSPEGIQSRYEEHLRRVNKGGK